ncbi:MAG: HEAT repeat protein [Congregibacter sp.]
MDKLNNNIVSTDNVNPSHQKAAIVALLRGGNLNEIDVMKSLTLHFQKIQCNLLDIQDAADEVFTKQPSKHSLLLAKRLYVSKSYRARSLAVFIFGRLAATSSESLAFLKRQVSQDTDWHVIEIMAKAFNRYCADVGYENALPIIREWLTDAEPNVRWAVAEGLRVWTQRPYFITHPALAIQLLCPLRYDESAYVRDSVGSALGDISKTHLILVQDELDKYDMTLQ